MPPMLQRQKWKAPDSTVSTLEPLLARYERRYRRRKSPLSHITDIPELLGIEGNASAAYYGSFGFMLKDEMGFDFQRRSRRIPCIRIKRAAKFRLFATNSFSIYAQQLR